MATSAKLCWTAALGLLLSGCADSGSTAPAYSHPCGTLVAGVLDCPSPTVPPPPLVNATSACQRLVECGILSGEQMVSSGQGCGSDSDCDRGDVCQSSDGGRTCAFHWLDLHWCVDRFSNVPNDPCDGSREISALERDQAISCIGQTPCPALGLPREQKALPEGERPTQDQYQCADNAGTVWTASTCDPGILAY